MKPRTLLCSIFLFTLFAPLIIPTASAQTPWDIPEITQEIEILENGKLHIKETIKADFTRDAHRGIFRNIPVKYRDEFNNRLNLRLKLISVTDENGDNHPIAEKGIQGDDYLVKIGDASVFHNTIMTYNIEYEVERALNYFDEHDELYWNAYTYWEVPVLKTTVRVTIPEGAKKPDLKAACYTGYFGSTATDCTARVINDRTFEYKSMVTQMPTDGFTIVAGWPKDIVSKPSLFKRFAWFFGDNWPAFLPLLGFLFLFFKWWTTGRDPDSNETIIPRYKAPEGLTPLEVGTLIDERADLHDITAVIIDYAVKGYIKIKEIKKDYQLELLKPYKDVKGIKEHELKILDGIFDTKDKILISKLKYKFYKHLSEIKNKTYQNLTKEGYFVKHPDKVRETYFGIAGAIGVISFFTFGWTLMLFGPIFPVSVLILAGVIFLFGWIMPKKTLKGVKTVAEIKGLEEYIRTAEKDRIKFQENANVFFEKLLPYAMVLQMADKWGDAFKEYYTKPPNWFEAENMDGFNSHYLISRLSRFTTKANTAFASSPRSSGGGSSSWTGGSGFSGGFSGGGFGGGGGGGW